MANPEKLERALNFIARAHEFQTHIYVTLKPIDDTGGHTILSWFTITPSVPPSYEIIEAVKSDDMRKIMQAITINNASAS
jgi:hypothetical protein